VEQIDQGRLLASIAATSSDCILSTDAEGVVLWASPATVDILGWRPEELAGNHLAMVITRLGGDVHQEHLVRVLGGERVPVFVDELVRRDGSTIKASVAIGPVQDADGTVAGVTMILRDVGAEVRERRQQPWTNSIVLDADLRLVSAAASLAWLLSGSPGSVADNAWQAAVHPDDAAETGRAVLRVVADPSCIERVVVRLRDGYGGWRPMEHLILNRFDDPEVRGLVLNLRDVSDEVRRQDALRLSEALHRTLVERTHEGILTMAPDGTTSFANDRFAEVLGLPLADVYEVDVLAFLGLGHWDTENGNVEVSYTEPGGRDRVLELKRCPLTGAGAESLGSLVTVADVTEARLVESTLRKQALHDPLTGLPNRYLFLDRLETAAARHARTAGRGTAVLFLDLDGFKPVNDGHGHAAGDELLREVAARLSVAVRATDTLGRLGGDEFAVICEEIDEPGAVLVAAKILGELRRPVVHDGAEHRIGVSIGIAVAPPHPVEELLTRADRAMYRAKQLGGGRVTVARTEDVPGPEDVREAVH
jgi:diguanylate cyclase (GGDEF)-like protein/PAS domain S-box-containing protein